MQEETRDGDASASRATPPARARKAIAETRLDELRLGVDLGELVSADEFAADVASAVAEFATVLNRATGSVALQHGLPQHAKDALRRFIDAERRALVAALAASLGGVGADG